MSAKLRVFVTRAFRYFGEEDMIHEQFSVGIIKTLIFQQFVQYPYERRFGLKSNIKQIVFLFLNK